MNNDVNDDDDNDDDDDDDDDDNDDVKSLPSEFIRLCFCLFMM